MVCFFSPLLVGRRRSVGQPSVPRRRKQARLENEEVVRRSGSLPEKCRIVKALDAQGVTCAGHIYKIIFWPITILLFTDRLYKITSFHAIILRVIAFYHYLDVYFFQELLDSIVMSYWTITHTNSKYLTLDSPHLYSPDCLLSRFCTRKKYARWSDGYTQKQIRN